VNKKTINKLYHIPTRSEVLMIQAQRAKKGKNNCNVIQIMKYKFNMQALHDGVEEPHKTEQTKDTIKSTYLAQL